MLLYVFERQVSVELEESRFETSKKWQAGSAEQQAACEAKRCAKLGLDAA
jgi:hypothetical protein